MTETTPQHITSKYTHQPPVAPKRIVPDNYVISNKSELLHPGTVPLAPWFEDGLSSLSAEAMSSPTESMALISTKDFVAIDSLLPDMAAAYPHPHDQQLYYSSSPRKNPRYLRSGAAESRSPHGTSPHARSRGQAYGPEPLRLAPDRNSKEIPLDAQWTKIRRALVSPEVLERAGVRYEARLDYVAVLGRISREQIATYARKSAECRAARSGGFVSESKSSRRPRADSRDRREDHDDYGDEYVDDNEESVLWDESDSTDNDDTTPEKGTKHYPYIVSPPRKGQTSSPSTAMPKSILKNKYENRVRFDPEPYEVEPHRPPSFSDDRDRDGRRRHDHRRWEDYDCRHRQEPDCNHDGHRRVRHGYVRHSGDRHRGGGDHQGDHRSVERRDTRATKKAWG